nr:GNAT family N-acetyltransferase [Candidatus Delongbacteria bacterium]
IIFPHHSLDSIRPLSQQDAAYLYENYLYQGVTSVDYIKDRIRYGPGAGIDQDGILVAWALTHDDSAIGMMHVLEPYRRRGYAYELTVWMIHRIRRLGRIPFVQIEEANIQSIQLALKLGFVPDRRVHWLEIR